MRAHERRSRSWILITLAIADLCTVGVFTSRANALELLENPSFELDGGDFGPLRTGWDNGLGRGNDIGFAVRDYPFCEGSQGCSASSGGGFELPPGITESNFFGIVRPAGAGRFYGNVWGVWNGSGMRGSATQILDVRGHTSKPFEFSAWLAGRRLDTDYAIVSLDFYDGPDATGALLGQVAFDGDDQASPFIVGSLNLEGYADPLIPATQDNWTLYRTAGIVPATAASATVVIRGAGITGGGNNGYVDLVSLQVIPEPASVFLLVTAMVPPVVILGRGKWGKGTSPR